ncbi:STAS domain-containing protein [Streptomyces sp. NPDC057302]|uniref:STAS domain-containing protein n=1 Tax=Streptomyces sp. NPDC057302 TaxID=3346094 RepID=UPI00363D1399
MFPHDNKIELAWNERVAVITLRHEIDLSDSDRVTEAFHRALTHSDSDGTLLDLAELTFADSTLLGLILHTRTEHERAQRPFVLARPFNTSIQRLLEITGAVDVLPLADTLEEGLRQLRTPQLPNCSQAVSPNDVTAC